MNLSGVDLNLLVVLEALMNERSVSRAAKAVGLSQPATSNALARLRRLVGDPLLVRRGHAMVPTPRALELAGHVHAGLGHLRTALEGPAAFDATRSERSFTIATTDYAAFVVVGPLMRRLRGHAPGVSITVRTLDLREPEVALEHGDVDLAVGLGATLPKDFPKEPLFEDGYVCLVRRDHPEVGRRLTLRRYVALEHLLVSPLGSRRGVVDDELAARGYERRVALCVPHFLLAPAIVAQTDLIVTLAERVAVELATRYDLRVLPPPVPVRRFVVAQLWDPRRENDPALRWLRAMVRECVDRRGWEED